jgi:hypothetical protein
MVRHFGVSNPCVGSVRPVVVFLAIPPDLCESISGTSQRTGSSEAEVLTVGFVLPGLLAKSPRVRINITDQKKKVG